jgi:hypothetical protein
VIASRSGSDVAESLDDNEDHRVSCCCCEGCGGANPVAVERAAAHIKNLSNMVLISLSLLLMIVVDAELIDDGIWRRLRCGC